MKETNLTDLKQIPFFNYMLYIKANQEMEHFYKEIKEGRSVYRSPVIELLDGIIEQDTFHGTISDGTSLYRARAIIKPEHIQKGVARKEGGGFFGFNEENSIEPPLHTTQAARANIKGMSYLYLAEEIYTACSEIRPVNNSFVSLATFKVMKPLSIIDLTIIDPISDKLVDSFHIFESKHDITASAMINNLMRRFATPAIDESIYASTQFISDYFRKAGFDGIRFQSAMSGGTNITLFNSHRSLIQFVCSKVLAVHSQRLNLIDLDDGSVINYIDGKETEQDYYSYACTVLTNLIENSYK